MGGMLVCSRLRNGILRLAELALCLMHLGLKPERSETTEDRVIEDE